MVAPVSNPDIIAKAQEVKRRVERARTDLLAIQANVVNNVWNDLIDIPEQNLRFQTFVTETQGLGINTELKAQLDIILADSNYTIQDILDFAAALDDMAADIETNAALFLLTINATTKQKTFVTPVAAGVKTQIQNRITAALAFVS